MCSNREGACMAAGYSLTVELATWRSLERITLGLTASDMCSSASDSTFVPCPSSGLECSSIHTFHHIFCATRCAPPSFLLISLHLLPEERRLTPRAAEACCRALWNRIARASAFPANGQRRRDASWYGSTLLAWYSSEA
jgi:hypothetical protein